MLVKLAIATLLSLFYGLSYADYDAADLNKLFTDKNQRAKINATRSGKAPNVAAKKTKKITVNGYITRSDGKSVVWINNKSTLESSKIGNIKVRSNNVGKNKKVTIYVDGKIKRLKPGETWHEDANEQTSKK